MREEIREKLGWGMYLLKLVLCCWKKGCKATKISETSCLDYSTALAVRLKELLHWNNVTNSKWYLLHNVVLCRAVLSWSSKELLGWFFQPEALVLVILGMQYSPFVALLSVWSCQAGCCTEVLSCVELLYNWKKGLNWLLRALSNYGLLMKAEWNWY